MIKWNIYILYNKHMEENQETFDGLSKIIEDWNISFRIIEKIAIWDIRYSTEKIEELPYPFLHQAFLYYILRNKPQLVSDYNQKMLAEVNLKLKTQYSITYFQYFKQNKNFNFTLIVLAKVLTYFLLSHYSEKIFGAEDEPKIYVCIVQTLLGYTVDAHTYKVLEEKMKIIKRREKFNNSSLNQSKFQLKVSRIDSKLSKVSRMDSKLRKMKTFTNKTIPRRGEYNLFRPSCNYNDIDRFKLEIREALKPKKPMSRKNTTNKKDQNNPSKQSVKEEVTNWHRSHHSVLNLHQVSQAMSMQEGFSHARSTVSMHIVKKRELRKKICPHSFYQTQSRDNFVEKVSEAIVSSVQPFSWNNVIENMRGNKQNSQRPEQKSPPIVPLHYLQKEVKNMKHILRKPTNHFKSEEFLLKSVNPSKDFSVELTSTPEEEPHRDKLKFKKINFMDQLSKFQKKCLQRREVLNRTEYPQIPREESR